MSKRIWDVFLTERDQAVFHAAGYHAPVGFGRRPVVLVIDVTYNFVGDRRQPLLESIERWPLSCGEEGWDALPVIRRLVDAGRACQIPIVFTAGTLRNDAWDAGSWNWKIARFGETTSAHTLATHGVDGNAIVAEIAPEPNEIVLRKIKPSAFHGTPLKSFLTLWQADSLLVAGTTTSGCVRATVIDAFSENYRVAVIEDACFDRSQSSHAINLCDMHAKYADVVPCSAAIDYLAELPGGLFALPCGSSD